MQAKKATKIMNEKTVIHRTFFVTVQYRPVNIEAGIVAMKAMLNRTPTSNGSSSYNTLTYNHFSQSECLFAFEMHGYLEWEIDRRSKEGKALAEDGTQREGKVPVLPREQAVVEHAIRFEFGFVHHQRDPQRQSNGKGNRRMWI